MQSLVLLLQVPNRQHSKDGDKKEWYLDAWHEFFWGTIFVFLVTHPLARDLNIKPEPNFSFSTEVSAVSSSSPEVHYKC